MPNYTYTYNGKDYLIEIEIGKTLIKLGMNEEKGLNEQLRFTRFMYDDEQKLIVVNYNREFVSPTGVVVQSLPCAPIHILNEPEKTIYEMTEGAPTPVVVPADPEVEEWDQTLGVPMLRKLFANSLLEAIGVDAYFDPAEAIS